MIQAAKNLIDKLVERGLISFTTPPPLSFVKQPLQSGFDIYGCIDEITRLLPHLETFINQFNQTVTSSNISVITDSTGFMSIDVPRTMADADAETVTLRIGVIDRLINTTGQSIDEQFKNAFSMKESLNADPFAKTKLLSQVEQFKQLNYSYKH